MDEQRELRQRIRELEERNANLKEALAAAKAANQAKSSFLSSMSHDIRTPMNAIVGMTEIGLTHIDEKPRVQDCLQKIKTASDLLMSLVNDVLDMSRIDSGRLTLNEEPFSLAELVHDLTVIMRPQAEGKHQELLIEIGRIEEDDLLGDSLRIRQILVNIIGNAVKYTLEDGNIQVGFAQRPVQPGRFPDQEKRVWLDFWCKDNGVGMSPEFLDRIFEPFERVNNTTIHKIEGTGLGMAIVKNLVDTMGGQIRIESKEGVGSSFYVTLPMVVPKQEKKVHKLPAGETVLVADSRERESALMAKYLTDGGLVPVQIADGLAVVTWLTERQYEHQMPCAMLLGQELSDLPVLELASHVRQLAGEQFPILLVSEEDWAEIEYRAVRSGVNAFVPCPLFESKLLETLAGLLGDSHREEEHLAATGADYEGKHILLVEDNELNQEIATEMLKALGVEVEVAGDGAQAVEAFAASPDDYFDIIFMDIQMPVLNGYEAAKKIRRLPRPDASRVWIVAMTANAFVEDIRLSREAGMNEHCSKPVDPKRLLEILRSRPRT